MMSELEALGREVKRVQDRDHRALDAALRDAGVTLVQWDALRAIDRAPGATAHDLAVASFQSDQAFGTLANRLAERGLIVRAPGRGRRIDHELTDAGRAALAEGHAIATDVLTDLFAPLEEERRAVLFDALRLLTEGQSGEW